MSTITTVPSGWVDGAPSSGSGLDHTVIDPATDAPVAHLVLASGSDVTSAVAHAARAQHDWGGATPAERSAVLHAFARLLDANADLLASEEVSHTGKAIRLATEFDVPGSIDNVDFFAGDKLANLRTEKGGTAVSLKAEKAGDPLKADGYSLTGDAKSITLTQPGKPAQSCKA